MRRTISVAFVAAISLAAVTGSAGTALAGSATIDDTNGDVWAGTWDEETEQEVFTEAGSLVNTDLTKVTVTHGDSRVKVRFKYVDLKKGDPSPAVSAELKTSGGDHFVMGSSADGSGTSHYFFDAGNQSGRRGGEGCRGQRSDLSRADDVYVMSVPRRCLGEPRWVKVHAGSSSYDVDDFTTYWVDNAHNDKHNYKGWTDEIKKG